MQIKISWPMLGLTALLAAAIVAAILELGPPTSSARTSREVIAAADGVVQATVTGTGNVEPSTDVQANFQTSGVLQHVYVKDGDHVVKGQLLATLDPTSAQLTLDQAEEQLTSAKDQLTNANNEKVTSSSSSSTTSASTAVATTGTTEFAAYRPSQTSTTSSSTTPSSTTPSQTGTTPTGTTPTRSGSGSGSGGSTGSRSGSGSGTGSTGSSSGAAASGSASAGSAGRSGSGSGSGSSGSSGTSGSSGSAAASGVSAATKASDIASAQASVDSAEAAVQTAENTVHETHLYAPASGTVVSVSSLSPGDQVSAGSGSGSSSASSSGSGSSGSGSSGTGTTSAGGLGSAGSGSASSSSSSSSSSDTSGFAEIVNTGSMTITVPFSESDIGKIKVGQAANVTMEALTGVELGGHVSSISTLGTSSSGVVSYNATITVDQHNSQVKPGMSASVSVVTGQASGVNLPSSAVTGSSGSVSHVNVLRNGKTVSTPVVIGLVGTSRTQIVSGLKAGQQVVVTETLPSLGTSASAGTSSNSTGTLGGGGLTGGGLAGGGGFFGGGGGFRRALGGG